MFFFFIYRIWFFGYFVLLDENLKIEMSEVGLDIFCILLWKKLEGLSEVMLNVNFFKEWRLKGLLVERGR